VAVVGSANSAGQAALFLARTASRVHVLVRGADLEHSMSRYLIDPVRDHPRISVHLRTEAVALIGDKALTGVAVRNNETGAEDRIDAHAVFVFIGAAPCTDWLDGRLATDAKGFLLTGRDLRRFPAIGREPFVFEASRPGVFCVGDIRSGSVKRVATAVGEGSAAVRIVFEQLRADGAGLPM
jgi:thioredoxin reductase (NADPH)